MSPAPASPSSSSPVNHLETLAVLALAALAGGLYFSLRLLLYVALALLVIGLFIKPLAVPISRAWLAVAHFLGAVNSRIILTLIFYLMLTPLAWLYRRGHGDFLQLKPKNPDSYWTTRDHDYTAKDLDKAW